MIEELYLVQEAAKRARAAASWREFQAWLIELERTGVRAYDVLGHYLDPMIPGPHKLLSSQHWYDLLRTWEEP